MWQLFKAYLKDEDGQTSTEYILLLAVVALIVLKFKKVASDSLNDLTEQIFDGASNSITSEFDNADF